MLTVIADPRLVDFKSVQKTAQGLQIALICVVVLSNVALIFSKISRKGCRAFLTAKYSIQISLAFAGIVSALFYNVVSAIIIFDMENHGLNCMTTYLANCYFFTFLPMIYCSGLILLALDLVFRFKSEFYKTLGKSKVYPLLCLVLPWAVPFIVSCPLTLTDIQWELKCANTQTNNHLQSAIICCTIVPAALVLILALVIAITIRPKRHYDFQRSFDSPMYIIGDVTTSSTNTDLNHNGTQGSIKQLNGSPTSTSTTTGNGNPALSRTTSVPIRCATDADAYPSFTHIQSETFSREKFKLLFSMLFTACIILPFSGVFMYITTEYTRMYTTLLFYMVDFDPYIAYYATTNILNLYPIVIPLVWLCTKY